MEEGLESGLYIYAGPLYLGASPQSTVIQEHRFRLIKITQIVGNSYLVSFTDTSKHSIFPETQSLGLKKKKYCCVALFRLTQNLAEVGSEFFFFFFVFKLQFLL